MNKMMKKNKGDSDMSKKNFDIDEKNLKNISGGKNLEEYPNKKRKNPITLKYGILEKRNNKKEKE